MFRVRTLGLRFRRVHLFVSFALLGGRGDVDLNILVTDRREVRTTRCRVTL